MLAAISLGKDRRLIRFLAARPLFFSPLRQLYGGEGKQGAHCGDEKDAPVSMLGPRHGRDAELRRGRYEADPVQRPAEAGILGCRAGFVDGHAESGLRWSQGFGALGVLFFLYFFQFGPFLIQNFLHALSNLVSIWIPARAPFHPVVKISDHAADDPAGIVADVA